MERERPEYLPPIEKPRWNFPWLLVIGITVLALAGLGVKQHLDTQKAWQSRFANTAAATHDTDTQRLQEIRAEAERQARIAEIRLRRVMEERKAAEEKKNWRCINHVPFRQIPGGWENVPGEIC